METLTLLSWPDYISPQTLRQFEQEHRIRVIVELVPSAVEMVERMQAPTPPPDLLCPPDYAVRELSAAGLLQPLDRARLPNLQYLEPAFLTSRPHDPQGDYSVVKDWGTTGILFRTDKINPAPQSWADFWALAERFPGRAIVLDSPGEVIGAALKLRGHSYNASHTAALAQARLDLLALKEHLLAFETDYRSLLASGWAWMALGWNGDAAALRTGGEPVGYAIPAEGSQIWEDDWAIGRRAGATNSAASLDTAYAFLNFVLRPEIAAQEARYTGYATANRVAFEMLPKEIQEDATIYPPAALRARLEPGLPLDEQARRRRLEIWQEIRGQPEANP